MRRLASPRWLLCHVVMVALVVTFLRLGWWQLTRAEGGNGLSIGYTLEWPAFAAFVVIVWLREVRSTLRVARAGDAADPGAAPAAGDASTPDAPTAARGARTPVPTADLLSQARAARAARTRQVLDARDTEGVSAHE